MSRAFAFALALGCVSLVSSTAARSPRAASVHDPGLDELDAHIQARFLNADTRFGFTRIAPRGDHHLAVRRFRPENDAEAATIASLDRAGLQVVLYLAGRALLKAPSGIPETRVQPPAGAQPTARPPMPAWLALRRVLEGPVAVSPSNRAPALPQPPAPAGLMDDARAAFAIFSRGDATHTFGRDGWSMTARPVRASSERCLQCHRLQYGGAGATLAIGDVLGVVVYGVRPLPVP